MKKQEHKPSLKSPLPYPFPTKKQHGLIAGSQVEIQPSRAVLDHNYNQTKDKSNFPIRDLFRLKVIQQCHGHLQYPNINTAQSVRWK